MYDSDFVNSVFSRASSYYDNMNDVMTLGRHRAWKRDLIKKIFSLPCLTASCHFDSSLLDLAGGTGDVALRFLNAGGLGATVCDRNEEMLKAAKKSRRNVDVLEWVCADAQNLPFKDNSFDYVTCSFGMRNISDPKKAVLEALRVLKAGGRFFSLELSSGVSRGVASDAFKRVISASVPKIGEMFFKDADSYRYLFESAANFYSPAAFSYILKESGFLSVRYEVMGFGMVMMHYGMKHC